MVKKYASVTGVNSFAENIFKVFTVPQLTLSLLPCQEALLHNLLAYKRQAKKKKLYNIRQTLRKPNLKSFCTVVRMWA